MALLPPNASALERGIEATAARVSDIPVPLRALWDPGTCPTPHLPWLAWALSVDVWNAEWSEAQQRETVRQSLRVHRHKGTAAAVRTALAALGYGARVIEWFHESAAPYTFAVDFEVGARGIDAAVYAEIERVALATKNARSQLSRIRAIAITKGTVFFGAAAVSGESATVYPYQLTQIEARARLYAAAAAVCSEHVRIYPRAH